MVAGQESQNQVVDLEKLRRLRDRRWEPGLAESAAIGELQAALPAIIEVWEDRDRLRTAAQEVWDSVPASYEPGDAMVRRHAQALIALGAALEGRDG